MRLLLCGFIVVWFGLVLYRTVCWKGLCVDSWVFLGLSLFLRVTHVLSCEKLLFYTEKESIVLDFYRFEGGGGARLGA